MLVAVSGGGIQAAAWAARVLTGLKDAPGFESHVRFISAVSGGSVGAMNFLAFTPDCGPRRRPGHTRRAIRREHGIRGVEPARRGPRPGVQGPAANGAAVFLDAVCRSRLAARRCLEAGSTFRKPYPGRGRTSVELAAQRPRTTVPGRRLQRHGGRDGAADALCDGRASRRRSSRSTSTSTIPGRDVPVTTAVRLSSGFPYVVPAARADADGSKGHFTHLVDGGYFDNYGVGTLSAWTHAALMGLAPAERPVAASGHRDLRLGVLQRTRAGGPPSAGGPRRAWPYQLVAPLTAVVAMRDRGAAGDQPHVVASPEAVLADAQVCIESLAVPFGAGDAPLSWHLTYREKQAIRQAWTGVAARHIDRRSDAFLERAVGHLAAVSGSRRRPSCRCRESRRPRGRGPPSPLRAAP